MRMQSSQRTVAAPPSPHAPPTGPCSQAAAPVAPAETRSTADPPRSATERATAEPPGRQAASGAPPGPLRGGSESAQRARGAGAAPTPQSKSMHAATGGLRRRGVAHEAPVAEPSEFEQTLQKLDVYPKASDDVRVATHSGGGISIACFAVIGLLVLSESYLYFSGAERVSEFEVDVAYKQLFDVNLDLTLHSLPCSSVSLDTMDASGSQAFNVVNNVDKRRIDARGRPIGRAVRSTESPRSREGEGCRLSGTLHVKKVAGNLHVAAGASFSRGSHHMHDISFEKLSAFNVSHRFEKMSFGPDIPGLLNPLNGVDRIAEQVGQYQYYIKVVPTEYHDSRGRVTQSYQYSVHEHFRPTDLVSRADFVLPGVFVWYDFHPIKTIYRDSPRSFLRFLTDLCAICGGVFTVAGIIDAVVYHVNERMGRKSLDLGK